MSDINTPIKTLLRDASPVHGFGLFYARRTARAWWYGAWLRTLARFSRTYFGSFWLGLSNLISVGLLATVYGAVLKVPNPFNYAIYLGLGLTIWGFISMSVISGCSLFSARRDQLINNSLPAIFYCLEEWAFQVQTFAQAFAIILIAFAFIQPSILLHAVTSMWLPLINLSLFCFWIIATLGVIGARFKDVEQLMPILLQLMFLLSPILYHRKGLGRIGLLADFNPFYRVLEPLRSSLIDGQVNITSEIATLMLNLLLIFLVGLWLKRLRYRLPLWV